MTILELAFGDQAKPMRGANRRNGGSRIPGVPIPAVPSGTTPFRGLPEPGTIVYFKMLVRLEGSGLLGNFGSMIKLAFVGLGTYKRTACAGSYLLSRNAASLVA